METFKDIFIIALIILILSNTILFFFTEFKPWVRDLSETSLWINAQKLDGFSNLSFFYTQRTYDYLNKIGPGFSTSVDLIIGREVLVKLVEIQEVLLITIKNYKRTAYISFILSVLFLLLIIVDTYFMSLLILNDGDPYLITLLGSIFIILFIFLYFLGLVFKSSVNELKGSFNQLYHLTQAVNNFSKNLSITQIK